MTISPYVYVANTPINAIDPDGARIFFVGGAGNDQDGWEYISRWGDAIVRSGLGPFHRVNASSGKMGDVNFTRTYRHEPSFHINFRARIGGDIAPSNWRHESIKTAREKIENNLKENPIDRENGEQLNLVGYSFGSVLQAQVAFDMAENGQYIDNLVLIGSPIHDDSALYKELSTHENIGNVLRVDIEGDKLSNSDAINFLQGAIQNSGDDGPHFDLARPGAKANSDIQKAIDWLKANGVK